MFASALGARQQAVSGWLNALETTQKQGSWILYDLNPKRLSVVYLLVNHCSSVKKGRGFFIALLQVMKIYNHHSNRKNYEDFLVMPLRLWTGPILLLRSFWCAFGGSRVVLIIISCLTRTKALLGNDIRLSLYDWAERSAKCCQNMSRGRTK